MMLRDQIEKAVVPGTSEEVIDSLERLIARRILDEIMVRTTDKGWYGDPGQGLEIFCPHRVFGVAYDLPEDDS